MGGRGKQHPPPVRRRIPEKRVLRGAGFPRPLFWALESIFFLYPCTRLSGVLLFPNISGYDDATCPHITESSHGPDCGSVATFKAFTSKYSMLRESKTLSPIIVHTSPQALPGSCRLSPEAFPWKPPHIQTFLSLYPGRTRAGNSTAFSAVQDSSTATVVVVTARFLPYC